MEMNALQHLGMQANEVNVEGESYMTHMSIIHRFKDHIFGFKMRLKSWFYLSF